MTVWVSNTSPLIFLAKIGRLELLRRAAPRILVPSVVLEEIRQQDDAASELVGRAVRDWLVVQNPDEGTSRLVGAGIGPGESGALALAIESQATRVILDDLDARRFARRLGLEVVGTAGLLLAARLRGEIPSLGDDLERLRLAGFFISDELQRRILAEAGE